MTTRKAALATSLLVGCGSATQPPSPVVARPDPDPVDRLTDLARLLAADAVHHDKFARRTLYSWTTGDQIEDLRRTKRLLVRDESPTNGASFVDQVLYLLSLRGDPVAQKIYTAPFAKMRFAWPSMWATRAGWPNEHYGDHLIRISLKAEAWIAYLSTATGAFVVHDLDHKVIPQDQVLAKPERIAAIYFVSDASVAPAPGIPRPTASFREYAVCNESMIEWYEVGTVRLAGEVDRAIALIDALAKHAGKYRPGDAPTAGAWHAAPDGSVRGNYRAALALDSWNYRFASDAFVALAAKLRATPKLADAAAIKGAPSVPFAAGPTRNPPRIVRAPHDTFARPISATSARP
jgi:hypothetical protein